MAFTGKCRKQHAKMEIFATLLIGSLTVFFIDLIFQLIRFNKKLYNSLKNYLQD